MTDARAQLYDLLGDVPDRSYAISARRIATEQRDHYILERLALDLNGVESVPAYFLRPHGGGPFPCVLYNHAHGGRYDIGKDELLAGGSFLQSPPYAQELATRGIASLCIDHWAFGERRGLSESELFKKMIWRGRVLWGMMVFDTLKAVDYLQTRSDVDSRRIGTLGMSMGSTMAWWAAALDERIVACFDLCCLTDFDALIATRQLDAHSIYYYVPSLLNHFTTADINALICPRPHLSLAGEEDPLTPPVGLDRIDAILRSVYSDAGVPDRWKLKRYRTGHCETAAMRAEVISHLERWL